MRCWTEGDDIQDNVVATRGGEGVINATSANGQQVQAGTYQYVSEQGTINGTNGLVNLVLAPFIIRDAYVGSRAALSLGTSLLRLFIEDIPEAIPDAGTATVDDILQGAQRVGSSSSTQFGKAGGLQQAESDFKSLAGREEIRGPVRIKELPDGRGRAVLRTDPSTWGDHPGPSLDIQPSGGGYAKIKIRY